MLQLSSFGPLLLLTPWPTTAGSAAVLQTLPVLQYGSKARLAVRASAVWAEINGSGPAKVRHPLNLAGLVDHALYKVPRHSMGPD